MATMEGIRHEMLRRSGIATANHDAGMLARIAECMRDFNDIEARIHNLHAEVEGIEPTPGVPKGGII
jgi:hypothetical protein